MINIQHNTQAQSEWNQKNFLEQLANIGSEVYRASNWKEKNNPEFAQKAFIRSLELFDLTKYSKLTMPQFKELCRLREFWVDFFYYNNDYKSDRNFFDKYFRDITIAYTKKS